MRKPVYLLAIVVSVALLLGAALPTAAQSMPLSPTGLVAIAVGPDEVDLAWTDNSINETGFRLQRSNNASFTADLVWFTFPENTTADPDISVAAARSISTVSAPSTTRASPCSPTLCLLSRLPATTPRPARTSR